MSSIVNPSVVAPTALPARERMPMSLPELRLAVPEIPGYHVHWFRSDATRIERALKGGYQFVEQDEVQLNRTALGSGLEDQGSTDLGSRVSVASGGGERLVLMKIQNQYWEEDQKLLEEKNESIASVIRGDKGFQVAGDNSNRYAPMPNRNNLIPKRSPVNG